VDSKATLRSFISHKISLERWYLGSRAALGVTEREIGSNLFLNDFGG
jgi:hypothetical protein